MCIVMCFVLVFCNVLCQCDELMCGYIMLTYILRKPEVSFCVKAKWIIYVSSMCWYKNIFFICKL